MPVQATMAATAAATSRRPPRGVTVLRIAGTARFGIAALGQLLFAAYVLGFYGRLAAEGRRLVDGAHRGGGPRDLVRGTVGGAGAHGQRNQGEGQRNL